MVEYLTSVKGIDVNVADNTGLTPLHGAVSTKNLEMVKHLTSVKGIDINAEANNGLTPLHQTIIPPRNIELFDYLTKIDDIDANVRDKYGSTVLQFAIVESEDLTLVKLLVTNSHGDQRNKLCKDLIETCIQKPELLVNLKGF